MSGYRTQQVKPLVMQESGNRLIGAGLRLLAPPSGKDPTVGE